MQRNINFSLLTAKYPRVRFPEEGKNTYRYATRGSKIYIMFVPISYRVISKTEVNCGYAPIEKNVIIGVWVFKGYIESLTSNVGYPKYESRITAGIFHNQIQIIIKKFDKQDEGMVQCWVKYFQESEKYYSRQVHLILTGECIHLLIYAFKCALAGFYKM